MQTAQRWVLPNEPTSPALARRHLQSACGTWPPQLLETALLLTSELVTNAVRHGGTRIVLTVRDASDVLRVEVHDDGGRTPRVGVPGRHAVSGRGLLLVEALADDWGPSQEGDSGPGKSVWFSLRRCA